MKQACRYCAGQLVAQKVTRVHHIQDRWIVIENVPALVCEQCGETYLTPQAHDLIIAALREDRHPARIEQLEIFDAQAV